MTWFIWLFLPWKPFRHHVVSLNWKYKWSLLYVLNFKSIGWIVSKVEGGGGSDWPPPPPTSRLRVTIFSRRLLGLKWSHGHGVKNFFSFLQRLVNSSRLLRMFLKHMQAKNTTFVALTAICLVFSLVQWRELVNPCMESVVYNLLRKIIKMRVQLHLPNFWDFDCSFMRFLLYFSS